LAALRRVVARLALRPRGPAGPKVLGRACWLARVAARTETDVAQEQKAVGVGKQEWAGIDLWVACSYLVLVKWQEGGKWVTSAKRLIALRLTVGVIVVKVAAEVDRRPSCVSTSPLGQQDVLFFIVGPGGRCLSCLQRCCGIFG
jgi:hypothetical protein